MALHGEVRAAALMEAGGASGRASRELRSSARSVGEGRGENELGDRHDNDGVKRQWWSSARDACAQTSRAATAFGGVLCRGVSGHVAAARGARRERFRAKPGVCEVELAGGASRARRVADAGGERRHGEKQRGERWSEGRLVNKAKFKISFCKLNFSLLSWPQMKNF